MSATLLLLLVSAYFCILLGVAWYTSRNANNDSFFIGNRNSNWMLVAFGMIGTSLSGVTFVSVPGKVGISNFNYLQVVIGYFFGYFIVAYVLLPIYYRMQLTSIYRYLEHRFGSWAYKTGAFFFIISRTVGATARLYLVINVLQVFILDRLGIPFAITTFVLLLMILLYTFEGGVKTIVFTDTLQTTFMLLGLLVCIYYIMAHLHIGVGDTWTALQAKGYTRVFDTQVSAGGFWLKQILGGAFITVAMTGLDQEMMQKNISVRSLKDSQKNMITFSMVMVIVNVLFLFLGGLLYLFQDATPAIVAKGDDLFPTVALLSGLPGVVSFVFIIGLISALFPSADGALTALTASFCIDILGLKRREDLSEKSRTRTRHTVHLSMALIFFLCVLLFKALNKKSIIDTILSLAGYTYGPLLGLFVFGIFSKRSIRESPAVLVICLVAPVLTYILSLYSKAWFNGYQIGVELLLINAGLTYLGLLLISKKGVASQGR
ncbi:Na+/proline symporter [Chitinophaga costaii]|uniref:Na+/proline symporter n=1 Tax=Chitinophaga costaii TaxID=1335309 RepID=A0A1C3YXV5_9BACT|nr:sodium:solute symporter [Chitinophaga costaii]PUZ30150.1 sodium:solute symporter [Chitinophaga costaii]SCB74954.1 Na+/proline symporter [Chitinophaga costaii]